MFDENDLEIQTDDNQDYLEFLAMEALEQSHNEYPDDYDGDDEPQEFTDEELADMEDELQGEWDRMDEPDFDAEQPLDS